MVFTIAQLSVEDVSLSFLFMFLTELAKLHSLYQKATLVVLRTSEIMQFPFFPDSE